MGLVAARGVAGAADAATHALPRKSTEARRRVTALLLGTGVALLAAQPALAARPGGSATRTVPPPRGMSFVSMPGFHPPTVTVSGEPDSESGDIFLTPRNSYQRNVPIQHGPMIINGKGQLVWFDRLSRGLATNLEVQEYQGQPVLTWWQGTAVNRAAEDVIVDNSYRTVATLHAGDDYATDSHEFKITPMNTAVITALHQVKANLTAVGGRKRGTVYDDVIQELNIRTGHVLWEWHSYRHIPVGDSYARPSGSGPFDYLHLNSVQRLPDGNMLVSGRSTWAIYEIDRKTGRVIWSLGGKHSSFAQGPGAKFSWQHDARLRGNILSLFDDDSDGPHQQADQSSAKLLRLNTRTMRATLVHRYTHAPSLVSVSQGSTQRLRNGNVFVGWGADPEFSEYSPSGRQILNGSFALGVNSYRAYRFPWTGRPTSAPTLAVSSSNGSVTLYVSWNGATDVSAWRVLGGSSTTSLDDLRQTAATGFETAIRLTTPQSYLEVQALDSQGDVLGTSHVEPG